MSKLKLWMNLRIILVLLGIGLILLLSFLINVEKFSNAKITGNFILIGGISLVSVGLLFPLFYRFISSKKVKVGIKTDTKVKDRLETLLCDLFIYAGRRDERKLYDVALEFVEIVKDVAEQYRLKLRRLNRPNAPHILAQFVKHSYEIHRHHRGAYYLYKMRYDMQDRRIDDVQLTKGTLRFLGDLRPKIYGEMAGDLYEIIKKIW